MHFRLLTDESVAFCRKQLESVSYADGKKTQKLSTLYDVKENAETTVQGKLKKYLSTIFSSNTTISNIYNPKIVNWFAVNKYSVGDFYGFHVDPFENPTDNGWYDYGFSISLDSDYEGGEFVIDGEAGQVAYKLQAGEIAVFPVMYPHSVNEVTKGTRQNIIGWFSSNVSFEHSYMLKQANDIVQMSKSLVKEDAKEINKNLLIKSVLLQKYIRKEWSK
jgi:PKHD-type hydroxylase